jgi:hypothetical protein
VQSDGLFHGPRGVVGQCGRHFEGDESVAAAVGIEDSAKVSSGDAKVFDGEFEEQILVGEATPQVQFDRVVVIGTARDRALEDRRIRGETRDAEFVDLAREGSAGQQLARNVVEPDSLPGVAQLPQCRHGRLLGIRVLGSATRGV